MALAQAAYQAEKALGHGDNAVTAQDVTNPGNDREKYGEEQTGANHHGEPTKYGEAFAWCCSSWWAVLWFGRQPKRDDTADVQ